MALPGFQDFMLPALCFLKDGFDHHKREIFENLIKVFKIKDEDLKEMIQSGTQTLFANRASWALSYLKHAGLISSPRQAVYLITEAGKLALNHNPGKIDRDYLLQYPEFRNFITPKTKPEDQQTKSNQDPQEMMEDGYQIILNGLYKEILGKIKSCSPRFFELLVVELLLKMGYGGSLKDAGEAIGQSGDGGIDGIIKEDRLGLDVIYIQAKRWEGLVGSPEIQKFIGGLVGKHASKGVFICTSSFSKAAIDFVKSIQHKVILIDGEKLAQLMVEYDLGLTRVMSYDIKRIDNDFFVEE
jgi:restriction system protein